MARPVDSEAELVLDEAPAEPDGCSSADGGAPLYRKIASTLQNDIAAGLYPVGKMLPTETELCCRFGASRYTIREALRRLGEIGLVKRRAGAGTVVVASDPPSTFVHRVNTLRALLHYPVNTYRELVSADFITADQAISDRIDCPVGKEWFRLSCLRKSPDEPTPFCWGEFYLPTSIGTAMDWPKIDSTTVHDRIRQLSHHQAYRAEINISASAIRGEMADLLMVSDGAPGLTIMRRYFDEAGDNFTSTLTIHPEHRFVYTVEFTRDE